MHYTRLMKASELVVVLMLCGCLSEDAESFFKDYSAAMEAGIFRRGWLPAETPVDARDIRELHDLDTNATWASFSVGDQGARSIQLMQSVSASELEGIRVNGAASIEWWPRDLNTSTIRREDNGSRYSLHDLGDFAFAKHIAGDERILKRYIAFNKNERRAYYWSYLK